MLSWVIGTALNRYQLTSCSPPLLLTTFDSCLGGGIQANQPEVLRCTNDSTAIRRSQPNPIERNPTGGNSARSPIDASSIHPSFEICVRVRSMGKPRVLRFFLALRSFPNRVCSEKNVCSSASTNHVTNSQDACLNRTNHPPPSHACCSRAGEAFSSAEPIHHLAFIAAAAAV